MNARLKATVLGCGASGGVPRIGNDWGACDPSNPRNRRRRCALLLERFEDGASAPTRVLVDAGPDLREQLLAADVGVVDAVVFTHAHADHIHGIDDLRAVWLATHRRLATYADRATTERLEEAFGYIFHGFRDYRPIMAFGPTVVPGTPFEVTGAGGTIPVLPFRQVHGDIDSLGLRVGPLAYSSDISDLPDESLPHLADLDTWVVDALRYSYHPSHFSVEDALRWIARIGPRRAVLTHLHCDLDYQALSADVPDHVEVAYDGMALEFAL